MNIGERQRFTEADRLCLTVPLFHCFGLVLGVMAVLTHGATLVILESFDPLLALASVQKERCTAIYGVPTMFIAELNHPMFGMFDLSSLRTGIMAGSPCPMEIMKRVMSDMRCREITIAYGLTEASPVITQTSTDDLIELRVSTVGQRLPGVEARIVNPETNVEVPPGAQGEVVCRGYNVMKGYYQMSEATAQAIDREEWLHSGDLGTMDANGYFRITGRIKDMIIRGGENISPREIEEFLLPMEGIRDIQVAGIASPKYGEEVGAFVIRKDGAGISEEDVRDFCQGKIARFKVPRYVFFVNAYPMTASGKVQKFKLREMGLTWLREQGIEPGLRKGEIRPLVSASFDGREGSAHPAQRVGYPRVPRGIALQQRRVIGNDHAVEAVSLENPEHTEHIRIAVVHEGLVVVGDLAPNIPQVYVGDTAHAAVSVHCRVHIRLGHL
jgi:fatty-acyl-CoA synthase